MKKLFEGKILTIPNLLSLLRLCLIPVFVWAYLIRQDHWLTVILLGASGLTDIVDGLIARRFHMVSDLGKVLDPLADKLTQASMLVCLTSRFPLMLIPFGMMVVKELFCIVTGLAAIHRTGEVHSSGWHGKAATVLLYATLIAHVLWSEIPPAVTLAAVCACSGMILLSGVLYVIQNMKKARGAAPPPGADEAAV
ncbi:MAG: CDP-alcohol phosphatidyltransferase family protein [Oscillospiraceae bacterium]|nr:CDP-alcohol phosphatidyltransferase family protein [Oscillospiraceae bacterium]